MFTFITIILLLLLKVNAIALAAARCLEQIFWCQDFDHPGSAHLNAPVAEMCLGQNFFSHSSYAMCYCGLISLQLVAITEIATNNQDTVLLAKIFCNCLFINRVI